MPWASPLDKVERERVIGALGRVLADEPAVRLAYLHGSFAAGSFFEDVDVAALFDAPAVRDFELHARIADRLEAASGLVVPVDLRPLNEAPISFAGPIIQHGRLLCARDPGERIDFEVRTLSMWFDYLPTWRLNTEALYQRVAAHGR